MDLRQQKAALIIYTKILSSFPFFSFSLAVEVEGIFPR